MEKCKEIKNIFFDKFLTFYFLWWFWYKFIIFFELVENGSELHYVKFYLYTHLMILKIFIATRTEKGALHFHLTFLNDKLFEQKN